MLHDPQSHLSTSELGAAIEGLSTANLLRLKKTAELGACKCGIAPEDLIQEAYTRALSGERKCPRNVEVTVFLAMTIKSIVSSDAKAYGRRPEIVSLNNINPKTGNEYQTGLEKETQPATDSTAIARIDLEKIRECVPELFASDSEAVQLLAMGIVDGMSTEELQEFSGLKGAQYSSARRLFRRRIEKAFSGGWSCE